MPSGCSEPCPRVNFARPGGPSPAGARPEDRGGGWRGSSSGSTSAPIGKRRPPPSHLQRTCPRRPQPG